MSSGPAEEFFDFLIDFFNSRIEKVLLYFSLLLDLKLRGFFSSSSFLIKNCSEWLSFDEFFSNVSANVLATSMVNMAVWPVGVMRGGVECRAYLPEICVPCPRLVLLRCADLFSKHNPSRTSFGWF